MNATELRIGNLVYLKNGEISKVSYHHIRYLTISDDHQSYEPIPLTKEWLERFGFVKTSERYKEWGLPKFCIEEFNDGWYFSGGEGVGFGVGFIYVHQLQNLYFAMTHEELDLSNKPNFA